MTFAEATTLGETLVKVWVNGTGDKWVNISTPKQKAVERETPKEEKKK